MMNFRGSVGRFFANIPSRYRAPQLYRPRFVISSVAGFQSTGRGLSSGSLDLVERGRDLLRRGRVESAMDTLRKANALANKENDQRAALYSLDMLGLAQYTVGQYAEARDHLQAAFALCEELDDVDYLFKVCQELAMVYQRLDEPDQADSMFERALQCARVAEDRRSEAMVLRLWGAALAVRPQANAPDKGAPLSGDNNAGEQKGKGSAGDPRFRSVELLAKALDVYRSVPGCLDDVLACGLLLARGFAAIDKYDESNSCYDGVLMDYSDGVQDEPAPARGEQWEAYQGLGSNYSRMASHHMATSTDDSAGELGSLRKFCESNFKAALQTSRKLGQADLQLQTLCAWAEALADFDRAAEAIPLLDEALQLADSSNQPAFKPPLLLTRARILNDESALLECIAFSEELNDDRTSAQAMLLYGQAMAGGPEDAGSETKTRSESQRRLDVAAHYLGKALKKAHRLGFRALKRDVLLALCPVYEQLAQWDSVLECADQVMVISQLALQSDFRQLLHGHSYRVRALRALNRTTEATEAARDAMALAESLKQVGVEVPNLNDV